MRWGARRRTIDSLSALGYLEFERGGCLLPNRSLHALRHRIKIVQERDIGVDLTV
jgi:hypothetical protein